MAVYSEQHKYIFFANPQTASKAIARTLRERLGGESIPDREITRNGKIVARRHHSTYSQLIDAELLTAAQLESLFKFTCVRNPFDQMVSKYLKHCERLGNDPAQYPWLEGVATRTPEKNFTPWLAYEQKRFAEIKKMEKGPLAFLEHADLVIRFERLQAGFDEFLAHIGVTEPLSVTEYNITEARKDTAAKDAATAASTAIKRKKNYADYYDKPGVAIVEQMFAPIIERFGYRFAG
ncbi:MAG TPA: sulfotransferase family 2 domain-containing protein [Ideonella sp.]|nr:sulfotransferase family 2 domain-containing protein [Ideonella sp.]